ncbi:hypothetical protein LCGC14_3138830, partial [marine sediment metagenome]
SAYLVPFNNKVKTRDEDGNEKEEWIKECQLIIGYRGLIDLARRSGEVSKIETRLVYQSDVFEVDYGAVRPLVHRPDYKTLDRGEWYAVWALATFKDGTVQLEVMTRDEVEKIRNRSKATGYSPWKSDYGEMSRKTVVRRLCKYLPLSPELAAATLLQAGAESGSSNVIEAAQTLDIEIDGDDRKQIEGRSKADEIADALDAQAATAGDTVYPLLIHLRARVLRAVPGSAVLARLLTIERPTTVPSLLLSYGLYGDVDREGDVVTRNGVQHPAFVGGTLQVLSDV